VQAREAALQVQNAQLMRENLLLRREVCCGWASADPNILQVRVCGVAAACGLGSKALRLCPSRDG
jgi:hypothetical protein